MCSSPRTASVRPMTACLVAEYVAPPGAPYLPACEAMLTTWPRLRAIMRGSAIFMPWMTPWRLMSTMRTAVASSSSMKRPTGMMPALLTSTSSGPKRSSAASTKASKESRRVTSSANPAALGPISAAACSASSASRSPIATFMPSRAKACAVALPMPRAAPVIAATWPTRMRGCLAM